MRNAQKGEQKGKMHDLLQRDPGSQVHGHFVLHQLPSDAESVKSMRRRKSHGDWPAWLMVVSPGGCETGQTMSSCRMRMTRWTRWQVQPAADDVCLLLACQSEIRCDEESKQHRSSGGGWGDVSWRTRNWLIGVHPGTSERWRSCRMAAGKRALVRVDQGCQADGRKCTLRSCMEGERQGLVRSGEGREQ